MPLDGFATRMPKCGFLARMYARVSASQLVAMLPWPPGTRQTPWVHRHVAPMPSRSRPNSFAELLCLLLCCYTAVEPSGARLDCTVRCTRTVHVRNTTVLCSPGARRRADNGHRALTTTPGEVAKATGGPGSLHHTPRCSKSNTKDVHFRFAQATNAASRYQTLHPAIQSPRHPATGSPPTIQHKNDAMNLPAPDAVKRHDTSVPCHPARCLLRHADSTA